MLLKSFDASVLQTFPATFDLLKEQGTLTPIIKLDELQASLSTEQHAIVEQILRLDPKDYGIETPYAGDLEPVPKDLVIVSHQHYTENGEQKTLDSKYVPSHIFKTYTPMNEAFPRTKPLPLNPITTSASAYVSMRRKACLI